MTIQLTTGLFTKGLANKGLNTLFVKAPNQFQEANTIRKAAEPKRRD